MPFHPLPVGALAVLALAFLPPAPPLGAALPSPPPSHVVVVVEENHGYGEIIGSSSAPYINSLAKGGALMTQSFAVTHPSEPNYLELFSGSTQGVTDDSCPNTFTAANLGGQLLAAGRTFVGFSEDLPSAGYTGCTSGGYARKHNPWVMFTDLPAASNQPFSAFPQGHFQDLPTVSWVIPNLGDDMHDGTIQAADAWLRTNLDAYVQWARSNNSLLVLTFDEDDNGATNQIATLFNGPMVLPGRYGERITHDHLLRTLEDLYGLGHAGKAASVPAISDIWSGSGTCQAACWSSGNYVKFSGIKATAFNLTAIPGTASDGTPRAPVNGLQIVPAP